MPPAQTSRTSARSDHLCPPFKTSMKPRKLIAAPRPLPPPAHLPFQNTRPKCTHYAFPYLIERPIARPHAPVCEAALRIGVSGRKRVYQPLVGQEGREVFPLLYRGTSLLDQVLGPHVPDVNVLVVESLYHEYYEYFYVWKVSMCMVCTRSLSSAPPPRYTP